MGTLVIPLGDFMDMFIVNTLGVLHPIPLGVLAQVPWGIGSSTLGVLAQVHLSTTASTLEVLSQTCIYPGGITAGIYHGQCTCARLAHADCSSYFNNRLLS